MRFEALRVGELSKRTGVTVRTLHHYDEIGLLKPSRRSEAGYRLYTAGDVSRLQQVVSLRQLGFSLDEVADCLRRPGFSPRALIRLHIERLREQIALERAVCEKLEALAERFDGPDAISADEFLQAIERMTTIENYYTPEQRAALKQRADELGPEQIAQSQSDWADLIAKVRAERDKGTSQTDPKILALARRWMALLNEFTGGDPGIGQSLGRLWKEQGDNLAAQHGTQSDPRDVFEYLGPALAAVKSTP